LVSILLPWYQTTGLSFTLLSSVQTASCPRTGYCEVAPVPPILIAVFVFTLLGGSFGISSVLLHRRSARLSGILVGLGFATQLTGMLMSMSDSFVRDGLSIGFYTGGFSTALFIMHILIERIT